MIYLKNERGVAIVLGILIILMLGILAAVSFDLALIFSVRNQARQTAELGSLAAIKAHYAIERNVDESDEEYLERQMDAALTAAQRVLSNNAIFGNARSNFQELEFGYEDESKAPRLIPGSFLYTENPEASLEEGGCGEPEKEAFPRCFSQYDKDSNPAITAYLIEGPVASDAHGLFSGFVPSILKIQVATVATFQPINFAGIIDTSRSVAYMTHRLIDDATHPCYKSEFAYSDGAANTEYLQLQTTRGARDGGDGSGIADGLDPDPCRHYFNDYVGMSPRADGSYGGDDVGIRPDPAGMSDRYSTAGLPGVFLLDMLRDFGMPGPEPFRSILQAYDTTLDKFEEVAKFGDKASLIAVSDDLFWPSTILPQPSTKLNKIREMLQIDAIGDKGIVNNLFPMDLTYTNLNLGLREALEQRNLAGGSHLRGMFVLITDGVTNCYVFNNPGDCISYFDQNTYLNKTLCCNLSSGSCKSDGMPDEKYYRCENSYSVYDQSINQLLGYINKEIVTPGIGTVSVIHVGPGANKRNKSGSGANNCLSESESMSGGIMPVYWEPTTYEAVQAFDDFVDYGTPFYEPAQYLFRFAASSGGVYIPVLAYDPACDESCDNDPGRPAITCSKTTVEDQVKNGLEKILSKRSFQIGASE